MNGHVDEMKFDVRSSERLTAELDENIDASLPFPNLENIKKERTTRTRQAMEVLFLSLKIFNLQKFKCF